MIDACFREVMRHKRPVLSHKMLAAVAALLRIDLILTTNFDDLIEQAFEAARNPLVVFDVHLADRLPQRNVVGQASSIVKLHGSQQSLRADYSLDDLPAGEDELTFHEYLAGRSLRGKAVRVEERFKARKHQLVMGVGGSEPRTMRFLESALRNSDDLKVFWVCHSDGQYAAINVLSERVGNAKARICVLRNTEVGLLLLHAFQMIRKTLPVSGTLFSSSTRLPLPPLPPRELSLKEKEKDDKDKKFKDGQRRKVDAFAAKLYKAIERPKAKTKTARERKIFVAYAENDVQRLSIAGSIVFSQARIQQCLCVAGDE